MTLKDLLDAGFVKDEDIITIRTSFLGKFSQIRKGNSFNDQVLDVMDREIVTLNLTSYSSWGEWEITLESNEFEDE